MDTTNEKTSTLQLLDELRDKGFLHTFVVEGGALKCIETETAYQSKDISVRGSYRFEGVSDPDDSRVVYALEAMDGTRGSITDAYGVYASQELADFLQGAHDQREHSPIMNDIPSTKTIQIKVS